VWTSKLYPRYRRDGSLFLFEGLRSYPYRRRQEADAEILLGTGVLTLWRRHLIRHAFHRHAESATPQRQCRASSTGHAIQRRASGAQAARLLRGDRALAVAPGTRVPVLGPRRRGGAEGRRRRLGTRNPTTSVGVRDAPVTVDARGCRDNAPTHAISVLFITNPPEPLPGLSKNAPISARILTAKPPLWRAPTTGHKRPNQSFS